MSRFESLSLAVSAARFTSARFDCPCYVVESIDGYRATTTPRKAYVVERFEPIPASNQNFFVGAFFVVVSTVSAVVVTTFSVGFWLCY
jgi:hypothetical protein